MLRKYLSIDIGASSGRIILSTTHNNQADIKELYRFSNHPIKLNGTLFWDFNQLMTSIYQGLELSYKEHPEILSIGIDTWGCDYGFIGNNDELLRNPVCYRDSRTKGIESKVYQVISKSDLYDKTGIQYLHFNTIYQLTYDAKFNTELLSQAKHIMLIPDLIAFHLTGNARTELTNLSTTNLYNPNEKEIIKEISELGIDIHKFPAMIQPGEMYGTVKESIAKAYNIPQTKVVAVCSHDTASAVLSLPIRKQAYISSGTWSLVGTVLAHPLMTRQASIENYTNEVGHNHSIRFLKNIIGLWIINQCLETWKSEGHEYSFKDLEIMSLSDNQKTALIDPDHPMFEQPSNMVNKIQQFCEMTGQIVPLSPGEILTTIYKSMAHKYKYALDRLEMITGQTYPSIVIIGGGGEINILNQMTSDICRKTVIIGSKEATALGNAMVLWSEDQNISIEDCKQLANKLIERKIYEPSSRQYHKEYDDFHEVMKRSARIHE